MDMSDLILAGIAAAKRWPEIELEKVTIGTVPKGTAQWQVVLYTPTAVTYIEEGSGALAPVFDNETILLEPLRTMSSEIWIGYGPQSQQLRFWVLK